MSERFYLSAPPRDGHATLAGDEARHLVRVMRCTVGDEVVVFDGRGTSWRGRVAAIGRDEVRLEVDAPRPRVPRVRPPLTLAVALPKGERQKWLVEKLTELGVDRLVPLETARGVAMPTAAAVERLARGVIEACKQCGRDELMEVAEPASIAAVVRAAGPEALVVITDRDGEPLDAAAVAGRPIVGLVGPEGGFTAEELATAGAAGGRKISLGPHVLRVETAAVALAARLA